MHTAYILYLHKFRNFANIIVEGIYLALLKKEVHIGLPNNLKMIFFLDQLYTINNSLGISYKFHQFQLFSWGTDSGKHTYCLFSYKMKFMLYNDSQIHTLSSFRGKFYL